MMDVCVCGGCGALRAGVARKSKPAPPHKHTHTTLPHPCSFARTHTHANTHLAVDDGRELGARADLLQHGDHGNWVRRAKHRAKEQALWPRPAELGAGEKVARAHGDEQKGDDDARQREQQHGRPVLADEVLLGGGCCVAGRVGWLVGGVVWGFWGS